MTAIDAAAEELAPLVGRKRACQVLGLSRAGWYRRHPKNHPTDNPTSSPTGSPTSSPAGSPTGPAGGSAGVAGGVVPRGGVQPAALSEAERAELWAVMHSEEFVDLAPAEIYAGLLDQGRYLASIRTMYRELHRHYGQVPDRRRQATHPARTRPELCTSGPNELWSWDVERHEALSTVR